MVSATLNLYGVRPNTSGYAPQGNSYYPNSPYAPTTNPTWVRRVLSDWKATTITWDNKPAVTTQDQVAIPPSTQQWAYNVLNLDVTALVKNMVSTRKNYGFSLEMQTEIYYRNILFGSSKSTDPSIRPWLVVRYE